MNTHHEEFLQHISHFVRFLMDGVGDSSAVRDIGIPHRRALEYEQTTEGCVVHQRKSLRVVQVTQVTG